MPLYDVWSLLPYEPDYARYHTMAMVARPDRLIIAAESPAAWTATARAVGIAQEDGPERAAAIAGAVPETFEQAADVLPAELRASPVVAALTSQLQARSTQCLDALAGRGSAPR